LQQLHWPRCWVRLLTLNIATGGAITVPTVPTLSPRILPPPASMTSTAVARRTPTAYTTFVAVTLAQIRILVYAISCGEIPGRDWI